MQMQTQANTLRHSDTNLSYSSLVTLYIWGKVNKQGFKERRHMKGNSNSVEYIEKERLFELKYNMSIHRAGLYEIKHEG